MLEGLILDASGRRLGRLLRSHDKSHAHDDTARQQLELDRLCLRELAEQLRSEALLVKRVEVCLKRELAHYDRLVCLAGVEG